MSSTTRPRLLIVDDEPDMRWVLSGLFAGEGFETAEADNARTALQQLGDDTFDVVLTDVRMPGGDGLELLHELAETDSDLPVVLLSALDDLDTAVRAMKLGAYDYVSKPFDRDRLLTTVGRAAEQHRLRREVADLRGKLAEKQTCFGVSAKAAELERTVSLIAPQQTMAVLLTGESGTGKEVLAREIHRCSPVAGGPFVAVDCGALPEPLMESQLFGHRKGAFTGAHRDQTGLFRMSDGGTLFLDEIGNLPKSLQAKLLRALQERAVTPVGGGEPEPFECRLVSATNAELEDDMKEGRFRVDLFHRIAEFTIALPALRERPEDVEFFAHHFLAEANAEMGRQVTKFNAPALDLLTRHAWPGNLRELRNAIRRAVVLCTSEELAATDLELGTPSPATVTCDDPGESLTDRVRARQRRPRSPDPEPSPRRRRRQQSRRSARPADRLHHPAPQAEAPRVGVSLDNAGCCPMAPPPQPWQARHGFDGPPPVARHRPPARHLPSDRHIRRKTRTRRGVGSTFARRGGKNLLLPNAG